MCGGRIPLCGFYLLLEFAGELEGRLSAAGLDGVTGTFALYQRLHSALDRIPPGDVSRVSATVAALLASFVRLAGTLEDVKRLKVLLRA